MSKLPGRWRIVSSALDGTDAQSLLERTPPTPSVERVDLSYDGKLITYARNNTAPEEGWDLYGFFLNQAGDCHELRITRQHWAQTLTQKLKTSPTTWDSQSNKYLLALAIDNALYLIYHDGTAPNGKHQPQLIPLSDSENLNSFHRLRLNPRFSNLLLYRRNPPTATGDEPSHKMWVVDWTTSPSQSFQWFDGKASPHMLWTPDGKKVGVDGIWTEYALVSASGRLLTPLTPQTVRRRQIGPFGQNDPTYAPVFYGSYSPDGRRIAIATEPEQDEGGKLWLMDVKTGRVRYLAKALSLGPVETGQPRLGFFNGDRGIAFSSDRSWGAATSAPPQIYTLTGYNPDFP